MLTEIPIIFILLGLAAYTVLAGADFGAGFWTLVAGGGQESRAATRDHARHAMGPVWEANHVWLIFVLVICWTAYPVAFGSIASTLAVPLFVAAVGIILRGAAYVLRPQLQDARAVESVFALSSILTPFALGTVVGAIASGRVPVGNAKGDLVTSWLNPTPLMIGTLAVATSAYLAAVYLAADAVRFGERALERDFRTRALWAGVATGALALAGLLVVRVDAPSLWAGFMRGAGLVMVIVSGAAGLATLVLVRGRRYGPARLSAALAVAAIVAGWGVAQRPVLLPGLTIEQAAAGRATLMAVIVSVAIGAVVLIPSLVLLFGLFLRGHLDAAPEPRGHAPAARPTSGAKRIRPVAAFAAVSFLVGVGFTFFGDHGWSFTVGVAGLVACAGATFFLAVTLPRG
ncbi:cytochrome d ubiquinol oxidase subunit II [Nonomuraea sp. NEAU-A123]|uniref:cytochrome d ubiquinol oxidase subunit II n=1 Tax=Nonomuraea sp. NEAU-A123 TaxID=2839649 RepID=UPI001BE41467|nr:cytochrome d ubiquinol oxidase subunit II [Nonomuraea sp. NEAU-A123]MBT2234918.1 cytochrome d ubiquinol oxidase subunit II [Nonomuraea sp. NEAU-A123]